MKREGSLGDHRLPGLEPEAFGHVAQEASGVVRCGRHEILGSKSWQPAHSQLYCNIMSKLLLVLLL